MPANQPPSPSAQPPPDVPAAPWTPDVLANYLRQFSLWCRRGFAAKVDANVAQQQLLLMESGVTGIPRVYSLTVVVTAGVPAVVLTQVTLGQGQP
jgi:hypothetical protein